MIYVAKKSALRAYKKVKHKFIKAKRKAITNNDLYKIVLLNTTQQEQQAEERYGYMVTLFGVFLVLCVMYAYHSS